MNTCDTGSSFDNYYHIVSTTRKTRSQFPLNDAAKSYLTTLIKNLSRFYTVEVLAHSCLDHELHLVCYAPFTDLPDEMVATRYNQYYAKVHPITDTDPLIIEVGRRMGDVNWFMRDLQQQFAIWFNRTHRTKHDQTLWTGRFKSTALQSGNELWQTIQDVESKSQQTGSSQPAEYRYCSYGEMVESGRHPWATNLLRHGRACHGSQAEDWTITTLTDKLRIDMKQWILLKRADTAWTELDSPSVRSRALKVGQRSIQNLVHEALLRTESILRKLSEQFKRSSEFVSAAHATSGLTCESPASPEFDSNTPNAGKNPLRTTSATPDTTKNDTTAMAA